MALPVSWRLEFEQVSPFTDLTDYTEREAARASGRGYASEKAFLDATNDQSGADLVGHRLIN